jgi:hypothetical protein
MGTNVEISKRTLDYRVKQGRDKADYEPYLKG